jgi:hypothetical protein
MQLPTPPSHLNNPSSSARFAKEEEEKEKEKEKEKFEPWWIIFAGDTGN